MPTLRQNQTRSAWLCQSYASVKNVYGWRAQTFTERMNKIGTPVAFIEAAWRRYTKHSKNKAQEIQGALLPIVEKYSASLPFHGVVLAGEFTAPALNQLRNNNFAVIYIPYLDVVASFAKVNFDIAFDETTPDATYAKATQRLKKLTAGEKGVKPPRFLGPAESRG